MLFPRIFSKKYPFIIQNGQTIVITSISIWLIIYLLQPFGFNNYQGNKIFASAGFGISTFISLIISNYLVKNRLLKGKIRKWTVGLETIYTAGLFLLIGLANAVYLNLLLRLGFDGVLFFKMLFYSSVIGIFPVTVFVLIKYNHYLRTELNKVINIKEKTETNGNISLTSINSRESEFILEIDKLLFIEAVKNHVHIYYLEDNTVKSKSLRNTFSNIIEQLGKINVFRCHRSFLVNTNHIKTAKGNTNGYKIYLKNYEHPIPVSRSYTQAFQELVF